MEGEGGERAQQPVSQPASLLTGKQTEQST